MTRRIAILALALLLSGCISPDGPRLPCILDQGSWICSDTIPSSDGCYFHHGTLSCPYP